MIYLDNAASSVIHDDVLKEMIPYFKNYYGNPSSIHKHGRIAERAIKDARHKVASLINANDDEIFFTSGGTESNNTALFGTAYQKKGSDIITSTIEHDAILEPCARLKSEGYKIIHINVDDKGLIDLEELEKSISQHTCLVSIMMANNEVGTIQPIYEIAKICKKNHVPFHTDAVQAIGKIPVDVKSLGIDMMSLSSHKLNGPKGVGALYIRKGFSIKPLILGGGQERGFRSGTENVANIVGFGKACEIAQNNFLTIYQHVKELRDLLVKEILHEIPHVSYNGHYEKRLPGNAHFTFLGINGEDLIIKLDENGIAASTGSACSVKTQKASHVLEAMGFNHEQITGSLRLSVGVYNTRDEIIQTVKVLKKVVHELRQFSPFKTKYNFN